MDDLWHAIEHPAGIWATLRDAFGRISVYFDDNDERVRCWSSPYTVAKAQVGQSLRDCRTY